LGRAAQLGAGIGERLIRNGRGGEKGPGERGGNWSPEEVCDEVIRSASSTHTTKETRGESDPQIHLLLRADGVCPHMPTHVVPANSP